MTDGYIAVLVAGCGVGAGVLPAWWAGLVALAFTLAVVQRGVPSSSG